MGHLANVKQAYRDLQKRHDQGPASLPVASGLWDLLAELYTEEEAFIASKMPWEPVTASKLAKRLGETREAMEAKLDKMCERGLVFDLLNPETGKRVFVLAPPVVGFMEFSMMRIRDDIDQKKVAELLFEYTSSQPDFSRAMFAPGDAQVGRTMVNEDCLDPEDFSEVLDYEKASAIIEESGGGALSLCYCRHEGEHRNEPCEHPVDICTSLMPAADFVLRRGFGRPAGVSELKDKLAEARERGLVQIADNVKRNPSYICHCCSCHCGQLRAINQAGLKGAVKSSNFLAVVNAESCKGCGRCVRACPVSAISLKKLPPEGGRPGRVTARVDEDVCLGCAVCHRACNKGALEMKRRRQRVFTPESTLERLLLRAIERGSVHHLLFGAEENLTMTFLHRFLGVVENLPPIKKILLSKQVKSRFLALMVSEGKRRGGDLV